MSTQKIALSINLRMNKRNFASASGKTCPGSTPPPEDFSI